MTEVYQFKSALNNIIYSGTGYNYVLEPGGWIYIDVELLSFGHLIDLVSKVFAGEIYVANRQKFFDKFEIEIGENVGLGGSGGGSLEPAGDWDIANSVEYGPDTEIFLRLENTYDCTISNNVATSNGGQQHPFNAIDIYAYGATTLPSVINDFSTTKWMTINHTNYSLFALYDPSTVVNTIQDIIIEPITGTPTIDSLLIGYITIGGNTTFEIYMFDRFGGFTTIAGNGYISLSGVSEIDIGINIASGEIYIDNRVDALYTLNIPQTLFNGAQTLQFLAGGVYGNALGIQYTESTISETPNVNPITEIAGTAITSPPALAEDGQLWNVISSGTYDTRALQDGDSVIFFNNKQNIIAITHPAVVDVDGIVTAAITEAMTPEGQIALGIEAILATKHFNSYGGEWFAGGQYDGSLTFIPHTSYTTYEQNTFHLGGAGDLKSDGKYWGLVRDASATIPPDGLDFDIILPGIQYGQEELVAEIRGTGYFGDLSGSNEFVRFSFINPDNTGFSSAIELTITYCNGNGSVVVNTSPTTLAPGDRISFNSFQNTATAYRVAPGQWDNLGSSSQEFSYEQVTAYVGYGRELGGVNLSFVVTMGSKNIILPPEPRLYKTYKATNTDGYSQLYNKTIKDNDLVTFILTNGSEDILVEPAEDLSLAAYRGAYQTFTISDGQAAQYVDVNICLIDTSNITERRIQISNFNKITYNDAGQSLGSFVRIAFNRVHAETSVNVGRTYIPGEVIQIEFDTINGGEMSSVLFYDEIDVDPILTNPSNGIISIPAGKNIIYSFVVMQEYGTTYGTRFKLLSKVEL